MLQRLLRRLFLPSVIVLSLSLVLGLMTVYDRGPYASLVYSTFSVFHFFLAPAATLVIAALAILVALQQRKWGWALVLTSVVAYFLALPFLYYLVLGYDRTPLAMHLQQWPFTWYATAGYSLWYGAVSVVPFAIWRFLRSQEQQGTVAARHVPS